MHEESKTLTQSWASDGTDIIFITGAPGSKWSAIAHAISFTDQINNSDITLQRNFAGNRAAQHFGNYFGPGMEYGNNFDSLDQLSKSELLEQFSLPYPDLGGIRLIKSHLFSRYLPFLKQTFPRARFVLVYRSNNECLVWWVKAGGFAITFPDYSWYRELENMKAHIAADNQGILSFLEQHQRRAIRYRSFRPLFAAFGLSYSHAQLKERGTSKFERKLGFDAADPQELEKLLHSQARKARLAYW